MNCYKFFIHVLAYEKEKESLAKVSRVCVKQPGQTMPAIFTQHVPLESAKCCSILLFL